MQNDIKILQVLYEHTGCICAAEIPGFDWAQSHVAVGLWVSISSLPAARFAMSACLGDVLNVHGGQVVLDCLHCKWDDLVSCNVIPAYTGRKAGVPVMLSSTCCTPQSTRTNLNLERSSPMC